MDEEDQVIHYEHQKDFDLEDNVPDLEIEIVAVDRVSPIFEALREQLRIELPPHPPRVEAPTIKESPTPYKRNQKDLES